MKYAGPPPLAFRPIPMARPWGGRRLSPMFGVAAAGGPTGEVWVVSAHPHGTSIVAGGELAGCTLPEAVARDPAAYLGEGAGGRFPLLVKFLDAAENLSVQVHPPDAYARAHEGDMGKTEAWVVLAAPAGGQVILGDRLPGPEALRAAARDGQIDAFLERRPIRPGDIVMVPAGTVHAVLAGTMLLEVQEASDVTYRIFDWQRRGRALDVEKAADVRFGVPEEPPERTPAPRPTLAGEEAARGVSCPYFALTTTRLPAGDHAASPVGTPAIIVVLAGHGKLVAPGGDMALRPGAAVLLPAGLSPWKIGAADGMWLATVTW